MKRANSPRRIIAFAVLALLGIQGSVAHAALVLPAISTRSTGERARHARQGEHPTPALLRAWGVQWAQLAQMVAARTALWAGARVEATKLRLNLP